MLALPADLDALAVGFLIGEGVLRSVGDLRAVEVAADGTSVRIRGDFDADALEAISRRWTWGTGCGRGGTSRDVDSPVYVPVAPGPAVDPATLTQLMRDFQQAGRLWRLTGGVHACALAGSEGILLVAEDVGRHNAFDKIVGRAAMRGIALADKFVLTTGRLTAEIVSKAVACRIPMLVSRSAVTHLAVELARRFALTLVGFVRSGRMNVYSGFQRVGAPSAGAGESR
jgi:FdhD protein